MNAIHGVVGEAKDVNGWPIVVTGINDEAYYQATVQDCFGTVRPKAYQSNLREAPVAKPEGGPSDDSKIMVTGTPVLHEAPRVVADVSPPSGDPPAAEHDVLEEKVVEDDSPTNWGKQGQEGQEASRWAVAVKSGAALEVSPNYKLYSGAGAPHGGGGDRRLPGLDPVPHRQARQRAERLHPGETARCVQRR